MRAQPDAAACVPAHAKLGARAGSPAPSAVRAQPDAAACAAAAHAELGASAGSPAPSGAPSRDASPAPSRHSPPSASRILSPSSSASDILSEPPLSAAPSRSASPTPSESGTLSELQQSDPDPDYNEGDHDPQQDDDSAGEQDDKSVGEQDDDSAGEHDNYPAAPRQRPLRDVAGVSVSAQSYLCIVVRLLFTGRMGRATPQYSDAPS